MNNLLGDVRAQSERLETVINSIDDGIVVLDTGRNVIAANDAFLRRTDAGGWTSWDLLRLRECRDLPV